MSLNTSNFEALASNTSSIERAAESSRDVTNSFIFAHAAFVLCICLQRVGLLVGAGQIFFSLVGFFILIGWGMRVGLVRIRQPQTLAYVLVVVWFLFSAAVSIEFPDRGIETSSLALPMAIVTNLIFIFGPSRRFSTDAVLKVFLFYVRLCAILGIIQIALQLGGIRIFSFADAFPGLDPLLIESAYNQNAVEVYGSLDRRANGFFPIEPGALSQLIAIAIVIDVFWLRRLKFLALYVFSYVLTSSGSGLFVLVATLGLYPVVAPLKSLRVVVLGSIVAFAIGAAWIVAPEPFDPIVRRMGEFNSPGSSGYARYVAQGQTWDFLFQTSRVIVGSGPGALERSPAYFGGSGNPVLKIVADYGLIGLAIFLFYLIISTFSSRNAFLSIALLVCYQLGGGNFVMAPFLIMMAMLCIWAVPPKALVR